MWKAKIIKKIYLKGQDKVEVEIEYSNGNTKILETYIVKRPKKDEIKNLTLKKIKELEELEEFSDNINMGEIDMTETIVTPTPEQVEKADYINDLDLFYKLKKAIDIKIISADNIQFAEIKTRLKNNFKLEYLDLF